MRRVCVLMACAQEHDVLALYPLDEFNTATRVDDNVLLV
jgi:hypothetical protein